VLRELLATFIHTVMGAEADAFNSTPSDLTLPQGETSRFAQEAR
jgi:hypothetical protein